MSTTYVCIYVCMYVCMYTYIDMYVCIYTYINVYVFRSNCFIPLNAYIQSSAHVGICHSYLPHCQVDHSLFGLYSIILN